MSPIEKESDQILKEAIWRRLVIKEKLTRFGTFYNGFLKKDKRNFTELKFRCDGLNDMYGEFDAVQPEIEEHFSKMNEPRLKTNFLPFNRPLRRNVKMISYQTYQHQLNLINKMIVSYFNCLILVY